jgi:Cdc6-like AAA superfamily ATPase
VVLGLKPYKMAEIEEVLFDRVTLALAPGSWTEGLIHRIAQAACGDARLAISILQQAAAGSEQCGCQAIDFQNADRCLTQWHVLRREALVAGLSEHERILHLLVQEHGPIGTSELAGLSASRCQASSLSPVARRTFSKYVSRLMAAGLIHVVGYSATRGGRILATEGQDSQVRQLRLRLARNCGQRRG